MEIPALVREQLGGEEIRTAVALGDEDLACATASRTVVYRSDGLLSDERIEEYPHDADRLRLSEGRRKTKFSLEYVDGTRSLAVPAGQTRAMLTLLLEGILGATGVLESGEAVVGAFRFSELTLVVGERSLLRHIGETVWDEEFTRYPYADLTGLDFEEGNVATEVVVGIDGRPHRIKTPRDDARLVEETIKTAVFGFYDVSSMAELREVVEPAEEPTEESAALSLGAGIDPLVSESDDESPETPTDKSDLTPDEGSTATSPQPDGSAESRSNPAQSAPEPRTEPDTQTSAPAEPTSDAHDGQPSGTESADGPATQAGRTPGSSAVDPATTATDESSASEGSISTADVATQADLAALDERIDELSAAVKRQNELLEKQHRAITHVLKELREE